MPQMPYYKYNKISWTGEVVTHYSVLMLPHGDADTERVFSVIILKILEFQ